MHYVDNHLRVQGQHRLLSDLAVAALRWRGNRLAPGNADQIIEETSARRCVEIAECSRYAIDDEEHARPATVRHACANRINFTLRSLRQFQPLLFVPTARPISLIEAST